MNPMLINIWFVTMVVLLLSSNVIAGAFNIAFTIFYLPFVVFAFYVLFMIVPSEIWLGFALMCIFIYNM